MHNVEIRVSEVVTYADDIEMTTEELTRFKNELKNRPWEEVCLDYSRDQQRIIDDEPEFDSAHIVIDGKTLYMEDLQ